MLSSDELTLFSTVVRAGSLSRAAELLGQTPSAISRGLSRLEERLETTLLQRTTRRMQLTEEGEVLLREAERLLEALTQAEESVVNSRRTPEGRLRVDAAATFMSHALAPVIGEFRRRYPGIQLELTSTDSNIDLLEMRTDVAIRIGYLKDSTLSARHLGQSRLRVLASPAYLAAKGTPATADELSQHTLLGFTRPAHLNHWPLQIERAGQLQSMPPIVPDVAASSGETLLSLAIAGQGILCVSDFLSHDARASGQLVEVLSASTRIEHQPIHAVFYRNTAVSSRVRAFVDYLATTPMTGLEPAP
ncbi:LysR substrate-binding domain-containing protein [Pokkaliibacter sp. CJK22405]|uniref:LysR substrate-binding domain-containing protein n=1 Tax=Pokkaliibacter sp. CJK22405 TaxID=3384615 RepID=UPI003984FAB6